MQVSKPPISEYPNRATARGITLLCTRYWPDRHGGVEKRLWHVTRALAQNGVPVDVVTENRTGSPTSEMIEPKLRVRRIDAMDPGRMWRWPAWPRIQWWRRAIHRFARRPIIWATDPAMAFAAVIEGYGKRLVYNPAGCIASMRRTAQIYDHVTSMWRPRHLMWIDRYSYRRAAKVIVSSHNVRRQLESSYGFHPALHVVPHGVETPMRLPNRQAERVRLGIDPKAYVVGAVGRLDPCKGLDDLLRAFKISGLPRTARILLVGGGSDKKRLELIAQQLRLSSQVIWTGDLEDPGPAYTAMDALALPSVYEAFGNVLLEAMAHGVPVIGRAGNTSNTLTACDEIIQDGHTGLLVDALSIADLASKLMWLYENPTSRLAMGRHAAIEARASSWGRTVGEYMRLLKLGPPNLSQTPKDQLAA